MTLISLAFWSSSSQRSSFSRSRTWTCPCNTSLSFLRISLSSLKATISFLSSSYLNEMLFYLFDRYYRNTRSSVSLFTSSCAICLSHLSLLTIVINLSASAISPCRSCLIRYDCSMATVLSWSKEAYVYLKLYTSFSNYFILLFRRTMSY